MTRILVVSPVPTHPTTAGNRARIKSMLAALEGAGHELTFLYSAREPDGVSAMRQHWGERLVHIEHQDAGFHPALGWIPRARRLLRRFGLNPGYQFGLDEWYNPALTELIPEIIAQHDIEAVLVEYVFLSRALLAVPNAIPTLLDTHDLFSNRHRRYLDAGLKPSWYSCSKRSEQRGLNRAKFVIAIQEQEALQLRAMTNSPVITIGHLAEVSETRRAEAAAPDEPASILIVGSANRINIESTEWFIAGVLPEVRAAHPQAVLTVAGDLCKSLTPSDGVNLLGRVADLHTLYQTAQVVVNPMLTGTGLKIKTIEALGQGCPLISSRAGAEGLLDAAGSAYLLAENPTEFSAATIRVLDDSRFAATLGNRGRDFALEYNKHCLSGLAEVLP